MTTMFCLVSRQSMANVIPVLMYKPQHVVLFATPEEHRSADLLQSLFGSKSINVKRINGLNAYDYLSFKKVVSDLLEKTNGDVWLNVTGGTKLMALAAYEAFAEKEKTIIYCDTVHQNVIYLFPQNKIEKINATITIKDYLLSYGYKIVETRDINHIKKFYDLFNYIDSNNLMHSFVKFNNIIREKFNLSQPRYTINSPDRKFRFIKDLSDFFIEYGYPIPNSKRIKLSSNEYQHGKWLEFYAFYIYEQKLNLNPLSGVKIVNYDGIENEIDLVFLKDYKLHLVSCKSGKKDNQYDLFQLETLRNITSGTFGKGIFITAKKPTEKFLNRARNLGIEVRIVSDLMLSNGLKN